MLNYCVLSIVGWVNIKSIELKETKMSLEAVLKPLQEVDGYLASAIFDMGGEVLVKHNNSKYNVEMIGANAVAMINAAVKAVKGAGLGKCHFIQVNSELGIFGAVWAVEDQSVAAVLLEPKANVGLAKMALAKVGEEAGSKLA
jgi:predicted regulator of Ras-like GTPase activity (Roadblock/LC7/MglB family)